MKNEVIYCTNCGAENKLGHKFCVKCGQPLGVSEANSVKDSKASTVTTEKLESGAHTTKNQRVEMIDQLEREEAAGNGSSIVTKTLKLWQSNFNAFLIGVLVFFIAFTLTRPKVVWFYILVAVITSVYRANKGAFQSSASKMVRTVDPNQAQEKISIQIKAKDWDNKNFKTEEIVLLVCGGILFISPFAFPVVHAGVLEFSGSPTLMGLLGTFQALGAFEYITATHATLMFHALELISILGGVLILVFGFLRTRLGRILQFIGTILSVALYGTLIYIVVKEVGTTSISLGIVSASLGSGVYIGIISAVVALILTIVLLQRPKRITKKDE